MRRGLEPLPAPDPDLVFATQGGRDVASYQDSIVPGVANLKRYLKAAGLDPAEIASILDFECGTGRLLAGEEGSWAFAESGYLEGRGGAEGSNPFASFHSEAFARELFEGLETVAVFPEGRIGGERVLSPIAMVQDVYLFRRP